MIEGTLLAGRYEVGKKVGAGGMSDVYKAKDTVLGRNVAIKILKQEFSEDRNFVSKFRAEAQSAAGLEHPNIVNIYDVGVEKGTYYIVMEYVDGITLKTYIEKKGQLNFRESVSIAIQVARGIEAAHNKEIIHRDIKPQNIIISSEGKVKVTDFGIARAASANTISSDVMGSVHYASPEQARNGFVDERSDIYSLGIAMYEMITGKVPFDGESTVAVAIQHLQDDMIPPSRFAPNVPPSFEAIIMKCAQKSPERRYQTMAELLADLRHSLMDPNGDFVVIPALYDNGKTKVISSEELNTIRNAKGVAEVDEDREYEKKPARPVYIDPEEEEEEESEKENDEEEEEDEDGGAWLNPKIEKAVTIMGIITIVVILLLIIYILGSVFGLFRFGRGSHLHDSQTTIEANEEAKTMKMINIVSMNYKSAETILESMGLTLYVEGVEKSDKEEGTIIRQSVKMDEMVAEGDVIKVVIAGESPIDVPSVMGFNENSATQTITNAKLIPEKTYEYSDTIPAGTVISQNPSSGKVTQGASIHLVISQGRMPVKIPSVAGLEENEAKQVLTNASLKYSVKSEYSSTVASGKVISQNPSYDKTVESGTTVTITISMGPKKTQKPANSEKPAEQDTPQPDSGSSTGGESGESGQGTPVTPAEGQEPAEPITPAQ